MRWTVIVPSMRHEQRDGRFFEHGQCDPSQNELSPARMMERTHHDHVGCKLLGPSQKELADITTPKRETHHLRGNIVALQMRHHVLHRRLAVFPWLCRHADE